LEGRAGRQATKKVLESVGAEHESSRQSRSGVQLATSFV
jgi:tRNA threonylcarbamoyladenosine modification (KEOPS) complex  Pcc1 subunit